MSFEALAPPIVTVFFLWWFSTGLILWLDGLPRHTFRWSLAGATVLLVGACVGLYASRDDASAPGAYCAFTCTLLVWGWLEMSFLMGAITGPRRTACPPGCTGWRRARYAVETVLHHELALILAAIAVAALTWGGENPVGWWTYLVLWISRVSAKLNIFLGARNLSEEFLPPHLEYLQTYFLRRKMNLLFPVSVTAGVLVMLALWADTGLASPDEGVGRVLVSTLLGLAIVEHVFLMMPMPSTALWNWILRRRVPG